MTIIAIAATVVAPSFLGFLRAGRYRTALRQVMSHLTYARTYAVSRCVVARLQCDLEAGSFALGAEKDPLRRPGQFTAVRQAGRRLVRLPEGVRLESAEIGGQPARGRGYVYFYPDGSSDGARLRFRRAGGQGAELRLAANTGRVVLADAD